MRLGSVKLGVHWLQLAGSRHAITIIVSRNFKLSLCILIIISGVGKDGCGSGGTSLR